MEERATAMNEQAVSRALVDAMKQHDAVRVTTLRLLKTALQLAQSARPHQPLTEGECLQVVAQEVQRRRDAIEQFARGRRQELVAKEQAELAILQTFLPAALSDAELQHEVQAAIRATGAVGKADMGKVMKLVMDKVRGRADGRQVNTLVEAALASGPPPAPAGGGRPHA